MKKYFRVFINLRKCGEQNINKILGKICEKFRKHRMNFGTMLMKFEEKLEKIRVNTELYLVYISVKCEKILNKISKNSEKGYDFGYTFGQQFPRVKEKVIGIFSISGGGGGWHQTGGLALQETFKKL